MQQHRVDIPNFGNKNYDDDLITQNQASLPISVKRSMPQEMVEPTVNTKREDQPSPLCIGTLPDDQALNAALNMEQFKMGTHDLISGNSPTIVVI